MKITPKQQEEIDWIVKEFCEEDYIPTQQDKETYIKRTVQGIKNTVQADFHESMDKLTAGKRQLDINIKMWRKDIAEGLFDVSEFEEIMYGYGDKVFKSIILNLPKGVDYEGYFRTTSILWANKRWGLKIPLDRERTLKDFKNLLDLQLI